MKKLLVLLLAIFTVFAVSGWGNKNNLEESQKDNNTVTPEKKEEDNKSEEVKQPETNDNDYYDDEIIDSEEDNSYYKEDDYVVVEEIINCDGCVFAYFSYEGDAALKIGSTLSPDEYTTDINNLRTAGKKQRHNFFGFVLSDNKISKAYSCILKDKKIYCIQGSVDGAYFTSNVAILNQIFTADQCKYISNGHSYWCTDGSYNGNTVTTGYTALHYETSCTIYGSDARAGTLICH